jgi:hypothetical protein
VCVRFVQPCSLESVKDGPCVLLNVGWWLVGWLCLTARPLTRCDPRKAANQAAFETVQRGTEWGCLSVPVCASQSLSRGRGAESAAMLRNSGGFVGLPRTIPIASATSLSEYGAVDIGIDMDLVLAEQLYSTPRYFVLARKSR